MNYLKLKQKIYEAIERNPLDRSAYEEMFAVCREYEKIDFQTAHAWNHELRNHISWGLRMTVSCQKFDEAREFDDLMFRSLLFGAQHFFDDYLQAVEYGKQFTHSMTLQLHEVFDFVQFNAPAAMYYAEEELAAGTYHVTPKNGWSGGMGNGKTYQFTLAKAVPKGGQIVWNGAWDQDPLKYDIKTYASPTSTTVIETVKPTEGTGGTELTTLNSGQRMCYGSNNYKESAVRGWLNSDKVAGSVWTPATNYDRPPSWVSNKAGFMNGMDADFLAVIGKTTKVTCRNNVTDGGGSDTTKDKFFLLSRRELFMGDEVSSVKEGEPYPYYSDYSDYTSPNTGADSNRVKYKNGSPQWQWERTPHAGNSCGVRCVYSAGNLNHYYAYYSVGVAPACNVI